MRGQTDIQIVSNILYMLSNTLIMSFQGLETVEYVHLEGCIGIGILCYRQARAVNKI